MDKDVETLWEFLRGYMVEFRGIQDRQTEDIRHLSQHINVLQNENTFLKGKIRELEDLHLASANMFAFYEESLQSLERWRDDIDPKGKKPLDASEKR